MNGLYLAFKSKDELVYLVFINSIASVRKELSGCIITTVGGHEYELPYTVQQIHDQIEEAIRYERTKQVD